MTCAAVFAVTCTQGTWAKAMEQENEDIVILFTNDVHCGMEDSIGYAGLVDYKEYMLEQTPYVTLVDCGDAIQGAAVGVVSKGEYIIDIMNEAGYDLAVLGNHEFDYGMEQLQSLIEKSEAQYLGCNISYTGSDENALAQLESYELIEYGDTAVGFVGISTPHSISSSTPAYFMDASGEFVYDFCGGDGTEFYENVQENVDKCLEEGADYVVALAHLGDTEEMTPYSSVELIQNTVGINAVLDGHAHSVIPCRMEKNKEGEEVLISSTGTKLENIGQLVITSDGILTTSLISKYQEKDAEMEETIQKIKTSYEADLGKVVAVSDTVLSCNDANGARMVRNRETAIGNFCADAYRYITQADIAFVNGGGIRADLPEGEITYADILAVHPFGNSICLVKSTGQEILDALEVACAATQAEAADGENAIGEDGSFQQVSGMRFTIDTSIESSVEMDENGMLSAITGERRVKDAQVLTEDGSYIALDPEKEYTVASHNHLIKDCGGGINVFADNELLIDEGAADYDVLIAYLTEKLDGQLGELYSDVEGRITVE